MMTQQQEHQIHAMDGTMTQGCLQSVAQVIYADARQAEHAFMFAGGELKC